MAAFPGGLAGNERGEDPYNDLLPATKVMSDRQWYSSTRETRKASGQWNPSGRAFWL